MPDRIVKGWHWSGRRIHYFKKGDFYDEGKSSLFKSIVPISLCKRAGGYSGISVSPCNSKREINFRCKFCVKLMEQK